MALRPIERTVASPLDPDPIEGEPEAPDEVQEVPPVDDLRAGRLLVRSGRFAEAEVVLRRAGEKRGAVAHYWLARAIKAQGREAEALRRFELLAKSESAGVIRDWAREDAASLRVKIALQAHPTKSPIQR